MRVSTIQPGIMVSLTVRTRGNVNYLKVDLENGTTDSGQAKARWETTRTIEDKAEFEKAGIVRSKARTLIAAVCARTSFGLIALEAQKDRLDEAVTEARRLVDDFNESARLTSLAISIMYGRIASNDQEAMSAMNAEMRDILDDMEAAVKNIDADAISKAATAARLAAKVLTPAAAAGVNSAIATSREFAKRIRAAADVASITVDTIALKVLDQARTTFLDMEDSEEVKVEAVKPQARVIDNFEDESDPLEMPEAKSATKGEAKLAASAGPARQLEL